MNIKIRMGNDEFILYIRKKAESQTYTNEILGKMIWIWLRDKGAKKSPEQPQPAYWGVSENVLEYKLPAHATQFIFDRAYITISMN
jgi:hypothetical protein